MKKVLVITLLMVITVSCPALPPLEIHMIDVGHGDSILVKTAAGRTMLIDCGPPVRYKKRKNRNRLLNFLTEKNINTIDILLLSHAHNDHIGGIFSLIKKIKIRKIIEPGFPLPGYTYGKLLKRVEKKKIPYAIKHKGNRILLSSRVSCKVLHPPVRQLRYTKSDANNNSLVLHLSYGNFSILFTGDIEKEAMMLLHKDYPYLKCTILKVPHHGSYRSVYPAFLKTLSMEKAIISCGRRKYDRIFYTHIPSLKTLAWYKKNRIPVFCTNKGGTISIITDGKSYKIECKRYKYQIIH